MVVRYEDLKLQPQITFSKIVNHIGFSYTENEITKAIENSKIEKLQKMEEKDGFIEKLSSKKPFFRKGKIGSWREELTQSQANQIINDHREMMVKFNYLDLQGNLTV